MKTRTFILGVAMALAALTISVNAPAQTGSYPDRPVRFIVPVAPGGGTDLIARQIAQKLGDSWGQTVVVDNRGGAGGTLGSGIASKAMPDGYTMLLTSLGFAINATLYRKLPYDPLRDFATVSLAASQPNLLVINPSVPAKSVRELIALAKSKPGSVTFASGGTGSSSHFSSELFRLMAGVDIVHVPYKGTGPAMIELIAGQVQMLITPMAQVMPYVTAGKLKALAVTGAKRSTLAPNVPTMAEAGVPGYEFNTWYGILVPAGTPKAIITKMNLGIRAALQNEEVLKRFAAGGLEATPSTPEEFNRYLRAEIAKWAKVIKEAKLQAN